MSVSIRFFQQVAKPVIFNQDTSNVRLDAQSYKSLWLDEGSVPKHIHDSWQKRLIHSR